MTDGSGQAKFHARVEGNLLDADNALIDVIYHFDGHVYGPVPTSGDANNSCRSTSAVAFLPGGRSARRSTPLDPLIGYSGIRSTLAVIRVTDTAFAGLDFLQRVSPRRGRNPNVEASGDCTGS